MLTNQKDHFPIFKNDETHEACKQRLSEMQYIIKSDLLKACVGHTNDLNQKRVKGLTQSKHSLGYVMLCFLVRHGLNLYRLPFYEERMYSLLTINKNDKDILSGCKKNQIEEAILDLRQMYENTQKQLSICNLKTVTLTRFLDDNDEWNLRELYHAATTLGKTEIPVCMDMLNSFNCDNGYGHKPIRLVLTFNREEVLYCHNLLANGDTETDEWVLLNRAIDGMVVIPITAIQIKPVYLGVNPFKNQNEAENLLNKMSRPQFQFSNSIYDGALSSVNKIQLKLRHRINNAWFSLLGKR